MFPATLTTIDFRLPPLTALTTAELKRFTQIENVGVLRKYHALIEEERFLKQKAKVLWLKEGDSNSAYFHKTVKSRTSRSRIDVVSNGDGIVFANEEVPAAFVSHYEAFLGQAGVTYAFDSSNLFTNCLDEQIATHMVRNVTDREIKDAMFSMGDDKAPGPDGYSAAFFKDAWVIIGEEITLAIREFFINGKLLKELNHTIIALIPKVQSPSKINDYRPISCCNVLFKCISKIIANRIKHCLKTLVSPNQSAFVPGRCISDNILLTQELMHNYHLDRGSPRCAFKVDIQKAYDTVDWGFLLTILKGFGFHEKMVHWIMECVSTASYSICINGNLHGYFKGKRGLRQGDPLSPYLFTLVMEVLTLMLQRRVMVSNTFSYHRYCDKLNLINLCFADDLFLFAYGDVDSTRVIKEGLDEFKIASGRLPVKYLGVPLVSSRLMVRDCKELVEKVKNRIHDWRNKSLSMAGRLQLIRSVIGSMHVFWASVFIIPNGVLVDIEQCMRNFLWSPGASLKGKAKVAWDVVCLPKDEGGLGIRRLDHFNSALMVSHIWKLLSLKESLWVKWIHAYKLCGRNFWDIPLRGNMSWGWRKILQLRPIVREFIWHKVGNGSNTSLWYDRWCAASPLANHVSNRDVFRAGLSLSSCISDIVAGNVWNWPSDLIDKYPLLNSCKVPLSSEVDSLEWRLHDGAVKNFSISQVWSNIRPRDVKVPWYHMVWFPLSIPRHAFNMWLIVKRKLKTQDRINPWDVVSSLGITCSLCDDVPDSHEHLFFNCSYASAIWNHMKHRVDLGHVLHDVYAIIDHFGDSAKRKSSRVVIAKLVVAASAYFIWQERNWRLFKGTKRSVQQVIDCIVSAVRLKLLTCRFKRSKDGSRYARLWDLPDSIFR
ncbi:putative RNA-directed DNA polymerase [Tanacetum coccineum]